MRILIDCSFIDFSRQPTGIPRVVQKYIDEGFSWSMNTGIEVIPVVITALGVVPVRPVPAISPPRYMLRYITTPFSHGDVEKEVNESLKLATHYLESSLLKVTSFAPIGKCASEINMVFERLSGEGLAASSSSFELGAGDVLFCPAYWHDVPPEYFKRVKQRGVKIVTLVHDILPITFSKFYQAPWKYEFENNLIEAIKHSDIICTVSNYTADSLVEFAARRSIVPDRVLVAYNGYEDLAPISIKEKLLSDSFEPYLGPVDEIGLIKREHPYLMVGTLEPKKGHIPVVASFEVLWKAGLQRPLVIVGRKGWLEENVVKCIEKSEFFGKKLFWFDNFDDLDLAAAYHYCHALIFGSYAEGFGLPMIEALKAGRPVVALSTAVSEEVIGEYGIFFHNFAEFAERIYNLEDSEEYEQASAHASRFNWPTWRQVAVELFDKISAEFQNDVTMIDSAA